MNKLESAAIAALALCNAYAMPTKQEIAKTRPLVAELMAPAMAEYKANAKTAEEVADVSVSFADSAKSEATRFLFLRGAVGYYVKGGNFGKAADTIEALKAKVKNVPPSEIADIISSSLDRDNASRAPRLRAQLRLAQAQMKASKDMSRLSGQLRKVSTDQIRRQYAEALALSSDWKAALAEFSKVSGAIGNMAKAEADGSADKMELGDFWWSYETVYAGAECAFRERAAEYYRKAIAEGKVDGLKKTLVEQRLASLSLPDTAGSAAPAPLTAVQRTSTPPQPGRVAPRPTASKKDPSGLVARWSFTDGLNDSIGGIAPAKSENAKVEDGQVNLQSGSPLEFAAGTVPLAPFTLQVWASATGKGLGAGEDFIFKIASSLDSDKDSVFWRWTGGTKWVSVIKAFGEVKSVGHGTHFSDGKMHLYTMTAEKAGKGLSLKFYQDDTCLGELTTKFAYKKPPMLVLGGFASPTYDEVRIYARALTFPEIIASTNLGPDKLPNVEKK